MNNTTKVALVDDHKLLRKGLSSLVSGFGYSVIFEADNGRDLIGKISKENPPEIILMDINMPEMDGFETALWIKKNYPLIKVLALSMYDDEVAIIRMLRNGAKGYVVKDVDPMELKAAIDAVINKGFYYSDMVTGRLVHAIQDNKEDEIDVTILLNLSNKDVEFLKLVCTEMTYKEIADAMHLSPRTIDGYRDNLFNKLDVKSRVGLVLFAIKHRIVQLN